MWQCTHTTERMCMRHDTHIDILRSCEHTHTHTRTHTLSKVSLAWVVARGAIRIDSDIRHTFSLSLSLFMYIYITKKIKFIKKITHVYMYIIYMTYF